jgi:predicted DNA-binding transcriptional regulator YafY
MRADRLLSTLLLLQAHGKQTGREIAARLEVSERTVHRDMEALSAAGVPVFAVRGVHGGWQLDEEWRTQVPGLNEAELHAFLMAQPRMLGDARLAAAAQRALDKLLAALPSALRERAMSIRQRLYVDTTGWCGAVENLAMLPTVQDAVARDRKLRIRYGKPDGERADRTVDPLGLVAKGPAWYLVALTPAGFRTYRVSRIEEAAILDVASARPADFDLATHWRAATEQFRESRGRFEATLRVHPSAAETIRRWRVAVPVADSDAADGFVTLRIQFDDEEHARFAVLGFGVRATVVAPDSLRARVDADIAALIERSRRPVHAAAPDSRPLGVDDSPTSQTADLYAAPRSRRPMTSPVPLA